MQPGPTQDLRKAYEVRALPIDMSFSGSRIVFMACGRPDGSHAAIALHGARRPLLLLPQELCQALSALVEGDERR